MPLRASQRPYRDLFESVWGKQAFEIVWPKNVESACAIPGPASAANPFPVHLSGIDRGRANATFDQMAQSIAGFEASAEVTAFSSKFDAVLAGKAKLTAQEQAGCDLFRGKAQCNGCHRDGGPGEDPLFTDFTAANIGTPANPKLPFYQEDVPEHWDILQIRKGDRSWMSVSVGFSPAASCLAIPRALMGGG
jgi:cytochrome c peroxidase